MFRLFPHKVSPLTRFCAALLCVGLALLSGSVTAQTLRLRGGDVDLNHPPDLGLAWESYERTMAQDGWGSEMLRVLAWDGPPPVGARATLEQAGYRFIHYLPDNAWLVVAPVYTPTDRVFDLARRPEAAPRWNTMWQEDYALHPEVRRDIARAAEAGSAPLERASRPYMVQVARFREPLDSFWTFMDPDARLLSRDKLIENWLIHAEPDKVEWLTLTGVALWVEPYVEPRLLGERGALATAGLISGNGTCVDGSAGSYAAWLAGVGLDGSGVVVHVMDDGLSQGDASNTSGTAHVDLIGRIAGIRNATSDSTGNSIGGHGHLNASIIMGQPLAGGGLLSPGGLLLGQGMAPGASVFATKVFDQDGRFELNASFDELMAEAWHAGARISNNSWGASVNGVYTADSQTFDRLTRDADPTTPGLQQMLFCFSAGNSGNAFGSIGSPGTAKNLITVGAAENCDADELDGSNVGPSGANDLRDLADFSSRGPTNDGRLMPTLVATGTHVTAAASDDPGFDGSGVSGRSAVQPGEPADATKYYPAFQQHYTWSSGTSHSSPIVAGAAALLHQYFGDVHGVVPSPALVKAALIAGALDPRGGLSNDPDGNVIGPVPNNYVGWGRVDMTRLVTGVAGHYFTDQETVFEVAGESWTQEIRVTDPDQPLRIVLVWTDPPAALAAATTLVNDLDLEVTDGINVWRGNVFSDGQSAVGGAADRLNNTECVWLDSPQPAVYTVTVRAHAINDDALPGVGAALEQDFALFAINGSDQSSAGQVSFDRAFYRCDGTVDVAVSDLDLHGAGVVAIDVYSALTADHERLVLSERPPDSGVLRTTFTLLSGPPAVEGDGWLATLDGDTLTAIYIDATTDSQGQPLTDIAEALVDCVGPSALDVTARAIDGESVVIRVVTDEPARLIAEYGPSCASLTGQIQSVAFDTVHEVRLDDLSACQIVRYQLRLTDRAGNETVARDEDDLCFALQTQQPDYALTDDLEPTPETGWTTETLSGNEPWMVTTSAYARSGDNVWFTSDEPRIKDARLISPAVLVPSGGRLEFWHTFRFESAGVSLAYDGGVLELSDDGGATWTDLGDRLTEGGYNATIANGYRNPLAGRPAWGGGAVGAMTRVVADLAPWSGRSVRVRWRAGCDNVNGATGWLIDNIAVLADAPCIGQLSTLTFDDEAIACGAASVRFELRDSDLSTGSGLPPGEWRVVGGAGQWAPIAPQGLIRIDPAGVWQGLLPISSGVVPGTIVVGGMTLADGATLTLAYLDPDADGERAWARARLTVDCTPPYLRALSIERRGADDMDLLLLPSEPVVGWLHTGAAPGASDRSTSLPLARDDGSILMTLDGLTSCTTLFGEVEMFDAAANAGFDDNHGHGHALRTAQRTVVFDDDMEPDAEAGWTHSAVTGVDDWAVVSTALAHSPGRAWFATNATFAKDASLVTPALKLGPDARLRFWHTFELEADPFGAYDGAVLEISADGGNTWSDLGPHMIAGGYNATINGSFSSPLEGLPAWSGGTLEPMAEVIVELGAFAGDDRFVRFRIVCDKAFALTGWYVDDIVLEDFTTCEPAPPESPVLVSPATDALDVFYGSDLTVQWGGVSTNTTQLQVWWGDGPYAMGQLAAPGATATTTTVDSGALMASSLYWWQVVALNAEGAVASELRALTTHAVTALRLARHLAGHDEGLTAADLDALDFDASGTLDAGDLVELINRTARANIIPE